MRVGLYFIPDFWLALVGPPLEPTETGPMGKRESPQLAHTTEDHPLFMLGSGKDGKSDFGDGKRTRHALSADIERHEKKRGIQAHHARGDGRPLHKLKYRAVGVLQVSRATSAPIGQASHMRRVLRMRIVGTCIKQSWRSRHQRGR